MRRVFLGLVMSELLATAAPRLAPPAQARPRRAGPSAAAWRSCAR